MKQALAKPAFLRPSRQTVRSANQFLPARQPSQPDSAIVLRLGAVAQETREPSPSGEARQVLQREAVCGLCERTVALALGVSLSDMRARTRCAADVALARQIAMYLCHTTFSLLMTEVGLHFRRDRTTVAHACALVEDKRDEMAFDVVICQLEAILSEARTAIDIANATPLESDPEPGLE